jgi:hypothetical protein
MRYFLCLVLLTFILSCNYRLNQSRYILYEQKALFCVEKTTDGYAVFESPSGMSKFISTSKKESKECNVGDTLYVRFHKVVSKDSKLFYSLKPYH